VREITKLAGVSHGAFYVHFDGKEGLLDELLVEFNREFGQQVAPIVALGPSVPLHVVVRQIAGVFLDHWLRNRLFIESYVQRVSGDLSLELMRDGVNPTMAQAITGWIDHLAPSRRLRPLEAELLVKGLFAVWFRLGLQYVSRTEVDRDVAIDLLVQMTMGSVSAVLPELSLES
jgi:AcrR family transcriptional regulator